MPMSWSVKKYPNAELITTMGRLNIKMSYQYMDSQYKDKTVSWLSYICNENFHACKDQLYIEAGPRYCMTEWCLDICLAQDAQILVSAYVG